jgi:hypothetical protein
MIIAVTCVVAIAVIAFVLAVRPQDVPEPEAESPFTHLDERKAAIYENLRDLQFEYRVGKLSDEDYQTTKRDLQRELAQVLAEVDRLKAGARDQGSGVRDRAAAAASGAPAAVNGAKGTDRQLGFVCLACGAKFEKELKFCGECGKAMGVAK